MSDEFDFVRFEDASHDFDSSGQVWCLRLRQWNGDDADHFDALYFPEDADNFVLVGDKDLPKEEHQWRCFAAFCFYAVILK